MAKAVDTERASPVGARASNAGDQYQELWALQQALGLLVPSTGLTAVTVEGIASEGVDEDQRVWDGVDCALYFGGKNLETANTVVIAQHKYSTTAPEKDWTIARLVRNTKRKDRDNSVLRRLADAFREAKRRMQPNAELQIRLVSNQGIALEVSEALDALRAEGTKTLNNAVSENIDKLRSSAGLNDGDLRSFAKSLDLSDCGQSSRRSIRSEITKHVAEILGEDVSTTVRELMSFMRELMMPEKDREHITRETVLGWFDVAANTGLFPTPSDFKIVSNPIDREPARALLAALEGGFKLTCLHGSAGCGKTTSLLQLRSLLSPSSVFALFDCYGGGRYLFSTDRRHLPEHAFTQIANEISLDLGIPFLLARGSNSPILARRFLERVSLAAELLQKSDPKALLVVGIDAADNSVTAARRSTPPEACFVTELATADMALLPSNVRLVFSARTVRKDSLELPTDAKLIPCPAFSPQETEAFAKRTIPTVTAEWIEQFHALSNGIPRVQDYAFRAGNNEPTPTLNALRPGGKNLADVLRKLFQEALKKAGISTSYDILMSSLAALPAPIPIEHFAKIANLQASEVVDFVHDTSPSLRLEGDGISIADEDAEDFIREEGHTNLRQISERACDFFAPIYETDVYAAVNFADLLVAAGRERQILPIIEKHLSPAAIADPIVRREIQLRRLRLAHAACRAAGDSAAVMKVVLLGAEASKDQAFFAEILDKHPDLSTRFARSSLVRLVLSDSDSAKKQGRVLIQDAVRAARSGDRIQAIEQLHYYHEWLARLRKVPREERYGWNIEIDDIAADVECAALLHGPLEAYRELTRWTSKQSRLSAALRLVPHLIATGKSDILERALHERVLPAAWEVFLLVPLALSGTKVEASRLEQSLNVLGRTLRTTLSKMPDDYTDNWKTELRGLLVTAGEIGFSLGISDATTRRVLTLAGHLDSSLETPYSDLRTGALDIPIRAWLLRQTLDGKPTSSKDFLDAIDPPPPPSNPEAPAMGKKRKPKEQEHTRGRKLEEEQRRIVGTIFSIYESRVSILRHRRSNGSTDPTQVSNMGGLGSDEYMLKRPAGMGVRARVAVSVLELMHLEGIGWQELFTKASSLASPNYSDPFGNHLLPLWRILLLRHESRDFVLKSLVERSPQLRSAKEPATTKVDASIEFSRLALTFSEPDARAFYEDAIYLAQEIDREAIDQVGVLEVLTGHSPHWDTNAKVRAATPLVNAITDIAVRLRNEENFRWDECVNSVIRLHSPTALAAVARWADQGIEDLPMNLEHFLAEASRLKEISPSIGASLLALIPDASNRLRLDIIGRLKSEDQSRASEIVGLLADDVLLCEKPTNIGKHAAELIDAVSTLDSSFDPASYARLIKTFCYLESRNLIGERREDREESGPKIGDGTFTTKEAIEAEFRAARQREGYLGSGAILVQMVDRISSPGDRVPFLNALSESDIGDFGETGRADAILAALAKWDSPSVNSWRTNSLPKVIVQRFAGLMVMYGWSRYRHLSDLLSATRLSDARKLGTLAEALEVTSLSLGSRSLFIISKQMAALLEPKEAWLIFDWYLKRITARVSLDETALKERDIPSDIDQALGRLLFALMSDIDTRIRWRAAHTARRLAKLGADGGVTALFAEYHRKSDDAFRDPASPYYWITARLWTVMSAARIAHETPGSLLNVHKTILDIALDNDFPHYSVREYAKSTVIALHECGAASWDAATFEQIRRINVTPFSLDQRKEHNAPHLNRDDRKGGRFDFGYDTVEHVLTPLLRFFVGLSKDELYSRLEHWLLDQWQAPEKANHWDREPRKGRYDENRWGLHHSDKGSMPIIERYGYYLESNAVLCVVGELLQKYPLWQPEGESWGTFGYWAQKLQLTVPPVWAADLRDPKPLEDQLWLAGTADDDRWVSRISQKEFVSALFNENGTDKSLVTVEGSWTSGFPTREVHATLSSALVNPTTAGALSRSLSMRERRQWAYHLPDADSDHEYDERFQETPYNLVGWLTEVRTEEGIDLKDTLRNGTKGPTKSPAQSVLTELGLNADVRPAKAWKKSDSDKVVVRETVWADLPERYDDERSYRRRETKSEGSRLQIDSDVLMSFLKKQQMSLIVGVYLERRLEEEYGGRYDDKTKKRKAFEQFFIFRTDGTIENHEGAIGTWWKAR
ncbi:MULTISPECIES: hypothetical protein [unclassified Bradyrhizobium]